MAESLRFGLCALLLAAGIITIAVALSGMYRFRYALNRIHAAGMCDSLGLPLILLACAVGSADGGTALKLLAALLFQWFTSPVSGHLIGRLVYQTDADISREATEWKS